MSIDPYAVIAFVIFTGFTVAFVLGNELEKADKAEQQAKRRAERERKWKPRKAELHEMAERLVDYFLSQGFSLDRIEYNTSINAKQAFVDVCQALIHGLHKRDEAEFDKRYEIMLLFQETSSIAGERLRHTAPHAEIVRPRLAAPV